MLSREPVSSLASVSLPPNENAMSRRYLDVITRWIPTAMSVFNPWPVRPNCGHFFGGVYWYGLETSGTILTIASAASSPQFDSRAAGHSVDDLRQAALQGLRYLLFTHDSGPADCVRPREHWGRPECASTKWGERGRGFFPESQCGIPIAHVVLTAALLRDLLTAEEHDLLAAVAVDYLSRFGDLAPRAGVYHDTQMEENAWTAAGITACLAVVPDHERAAHWQEQARLWMFRTATVPQDSQDSSIFADGNEVRELSGTTYTALPDFTAENHGFVHPTYMAASVAISGLTMTILRLFGKEISPHILWHRAEIYGLIKRWSDGLGAAHCVQGMDWPYLQYHGDAQRHCMANCFLNDPDAALLERRALAVVEQSSLAHGGAMVPEAVKRTCSSCQDPMHFSEARIHPLAEAYLAHRLMGTGTEPSDQEDYHRRTAGVHVYPSGGALLHNHRHGISSLSWRNRTMALPAPTEGTRLIGGSEDSLLGRLRVSGKGSSTATRKLAIRDLPDRVSALLVEDLAESSIRRKVFFCSLPSGKGISYEVVHALESVTVEWCRLGYLRIINDGYFGDGGSARSSRKLYWQGEARSFEGYPSSSPDEDITCELSGSEWVNIDDRMGFRFAGSGSASYTSKHFFQPFHAVHDELILGRYPEDRAFSAGEKIAELAVLWCPEQDHEATSRQEFAIVDTADGVFAALVDGWLCACNFDEQACELPEVEGAPVVLEAMEPRLVVMR